MCFILKVFGKRLFTSRLLKSAESGAVFCAGSSVNKVSNKELNSKGSLKIGFGPWFYHDVAPDVYFFEMKPKARNVTKIQFDAFAAKRNDYKNTLFVCTGLQFFTIFDQIKCIQYINKHFPKELGANLYFLQNLRTFHSSDSKSIMATKYYYKLKRFLNHFGVFFFMRGSVSTAIDVGSTFCKTLSIYGLDNSSEYFFEKYKSSKGFNFEFIPNLHGKSTVHRTNDIKRGRPTINFVLATMMEFRKSTYTIEFKGLVTNEQIIKSASEEFTS